MTEQTAGFDYTEVTQAVEGVNQLVRDHLSSLRAEQVRLGNLLKARESDLYQLRILVDDLSYGMKVGAVRSPATARWSARLESLENKETELRASVDLISDALNHLNSLISAVSSISNLGAATQQGGGETPFEAAIAERTLQGQEAERSRLAREVHDGPAQVVANSIMALEYCERLLEKRPRSVPAELRRIKTTMMEGLEEVRRFIFDLRPSSLEHEGLQATLQKYAADYKHRFGISVSLDCENVDELVSADERFAIFRIIQESMQNSRKHAGASRLEVTVRREARHVGVAVGDNGRGFDLETNRFREGHYGLQGMRERAESVRGNVVIFSEPGHGTEVRLQVPIGGPEGRPMATTKEVGG